MAPVSGLAVAFAFAVGAVFGRKSAESKSAAAADVLADLAGRAGGAGAGGASAGFQPMTEEQRVADEARKAKKAEEARLAELARRKKRDEDEAKFVASEKARLEKEAAAARKAAEEEEKRRAKARAGRRAGRRRLRRRRQEGKGLRASHPSARATKSAGRAAEEMRPRGVSFNAKRRGVGGTENERRAARVSGVERFHGSLNRDLVSRHGLTVHFSTQSSSRGFLLQNRVVSALGY